MRVLFLHEVGYLEKPIFEMHEFPEHLALRGHQVAFVEFREGRNLAKSLRSSISGRVRKKAIITLYSQDVILSGIFRRLAAAWMFSGFFRHVLSDFKPDVVVSFSVPTSGWQALRECRRLGVPYVFRALDVSHKIRDTIFAPVIRKAEQYIYSNADWVSCNNTVMAEYCISNGADPKKTSINLPPLDLNLFSGGENIQGDKRVELGLRSNVPVVLYMGSFFYFSGLGHVLEAMEKLSDKPYLILIGGGEQSDHLLAVTERLGLTEWVRFTGFVSYHELPKYFHIADVAINPMIPSLVSDTALPNKVLQYLASGLPVVSTRLKGLDILFGKLTCMTFVQESSQVLPAALDLIGRSSRKKLTTRDRNEALDLFGLDRTIDEFEQLLTMVSLSK